MANNKTPAADAAKEKMVTIRLPRDKNGSGDLFVGVNERTFLIKRGIDVEVPECVAEVIRHSEAMDDYAYEFSSNAASRG